MPQPRCHQVTRSLLYHVYNRGNARDEIFHRDGDYKKFISILKKYSDEHSLNIYHWVLMPNHFHLLVEIQQPHKLSSIMAGIARSYCHYHHRVYSSSGHLFQGRFKSKPIEKESYLFTCGIYIESNPSRARMVKRAEEYNYSSAKFYVFGTEDGVTKESYDYQFLGLTPQERQKSYVDSLNSTEQTRVEFFSSNAPMGSVGFKAKLVMGKGIFVMRRGRPRRMSTFSVS